MKTNQRVWETKQSHLIGGLPLNTSEIPQALLNIENKDRSNLFPWNGQFSPQFVEALLDMYATRDAVVLDPFAGSGTVLCEAGRKALRAVAAEINPAAFAMANLYQLINFDLPQRMAIIARFDEILKQAFPEVLPLFSTQVVAMDADFIKCALSSLALDVNDPLAKLLLHALIVRLDFYQAGLSYEKLLSTWSKLKSLILNLPYSEKRLDAMNCDARVLPLADDTIDLVITSPPYINVFNYHQQYRASAEALGWNLLTVAKSEIGANRKHRGNRFLTVIQYCLDLAEVFGCLARVVKDSGRVIFVVGRESRVRGTPFYNGRIASLLATKGVGFALQTRQERVFKNKFGELIYEDILHFTHPPKTVENVQASAMLIAQAVIEEALKSAAPRVRPDLEAAQERLAEVAPSPIYQAATAYHEPHRKDYHNGV